MSKNLKFALISVSLIMLIGLIGGLGYYLGQIKSDIIESQPVTTSTTLNQASTSGETKSEITAPKALFSGKIKKLEQDLKLLKIQNLGENEKNESLLSDPAVYYESGKFTDGKYKDYFRIVALEVVPFGVVNHIFATKDYQKYVLLNEPSRADNKIDKNLNTLNLLDDGNVTFDEKKIIAVDYTDSELPDVLDLNKEFGALKIDMYSVFDDKTKQQGLELNPNNLKKLNLQPSLPYTFYTPNESGAETTSIVIFDSTGLPYKYSIAWKSDLNNTSQYDAKYKEDLNTYNIYSTKRTAREKQLGADQKYDQKISLQIDKELGERPLYPTQKIFDLSFDSLKLKLTSKNEKTFKNYSIAFPGACGILGSLTIKDIPDTELTQIGTIENLPLYKLNDINNQLYKDQYKAKVTSQINSIDVNGKESTDPNIFGTLNNGAKMPTLEEYAAQNPLLLFRDPFNRLVIAGEWDYQLAGGCGKPAIYLYPTEPTKVNVKFLANIKLTTDIPKYVENAGWNVLAEPNGNLKDLQPQYTICDIIDSKHAGSEYAGNACKSNSYPYLYWSGNRIGVAYPKLEDGWIVEKKNLNNFLNAKLDQIGLNSKEKSDMLEYWIPYLSSKSGNYFKISFLQNKEMNNLAPMQITPQPDKIFRIFLDWDNYNSKPSFEIKPQTLDTLKDRSGFAVVEWGGLKK